MKLGLASEDGGSTAQHVPLQIKSLVSEARAQQSLSTRLVFGCRDPQAQPLLMPSCTYQSCIFIVSDRDPPSVVAVVAGSTCGSRQETDALAQDSSAFLTCPRAPSLGPVAA